MKIRQVSSYHTVRPEGLTSEGVRVHSLSQNTNNSNIYVHFKSKPTAKNGRFP